MIDHLNQLTERVCSKLRVLGLSKPSAPVMKVLLETAFVTSTTTEENRFVRGSLTYSDPSNPELHPPIRRRANYPAFTAFRDQTRFDANTLVKFSRAIDMWSGSIAVYGTQKSNLFIWGVLDQQVHKNIRLNKESESGYAAPGIVTINIDGVAEISVYHEDLFLGRLRQNQLITRENDILHSTFMANRISSAFRPAATCIADAIEKNPDYVSDSLHRGWATSIARICIGLRRLGTGGSLLITSTPVTEILDIKHTFPYRRLGEATTLKVLDAGYLYNIYETAKYDTDIAEERRYAETDLEDRSEELTGAIKIVTSLAAVDGLVLLNLTLGVIGFGVKIKSGSKIGPVFEGADFLRKGTAARKIDSSVFGTRHGSMLRYCQADPNAIGVVVSQDGHTRIIASERRALTLWDNVKLLGYDHDLHLYVRQSRYLMLGRRRSKHPRSLGYSKMPKTLGELMSYKKQLFESRPT